MKPVQKSSHSGEWRAEKVVLVTECAALGMIAVIRSLGRAGYQVHACSSDSSALGLRSNLALEKAIHPPYTSPDFLSWFVDYIADKRVEAIVPSEGILLAIRPIFDQVRPLLTIGPDATTIYRCFSKSEVTESFLNARDEDGLAANLPPSLLWKTGMPLPGEQDMGSLSLPIFIKVDALNALSGGENLILRAGSPIEAAKIVRRLSSSYSSILIQAFVPGTRVVADFCIAGAQILSRSMMTAKHENPHYGGVSTLRSVSWDEEIWRDAEKKLRHLGLEGVAMMEYRRDPETGQFYFIEINARYWLGLHVEIMSGIDIPRIHLDAFFGRNAAVPNPVPHKPRLVRYTIPGDIGYTFSVLKDPVFTLKFKAWTLIEYFLLCMHPGVKSDLNFPGDRRLYVIAFFRFIWQTLLSRP